MGRGGEGRGGEGRGGGREGGRERGEERGGEGGRGEMTVIHMRVSIISARFAVPPTLR